MLTLALGPGVRALDAVMVVLALCVGAVLVRTPSWLQVTRARVDIAGSIALGLVTGVAIAAAGGGLPDFTLIAAVGFGAILVGIDAGDPPARQFAPGAGVMAIFVVTWLIGAPHGSQPASLIVAVVGLAGIKLLALGSALGIRSTIDEEARRGLVYATMGRKIGVGSDVLSVSASVFDA